MLKSSSTNAIRMAGGPDAECLCAAVFAAADLAGDLRADAARVEACRAEALSKCFVFRGITPFADFSG